MTNPASSSAIRATTGRSRYGVTFWCVVVLIPLGIYVGTYYALVERANIARIKNDRGEYELIFMPRFVNNPRIQWQVKMLFKPLWKLDCRLRHKYWTVPTE